MRGCKPLNDNEIRDTLLSLAGKYSLRDKALLTVGLRTGLRISELLSLKVEDVTANGTVVDRVWVRRGSTKGKREGRSIALHPEAREAIGAWLADLKPADAGMPLFASRKGGGTRAIGRVHAYRLLKDAYARAGVTGKVATHSLRKSFAKRIYERLGHDLIRTAAALGHRNISSTLAYLSFEEGDIDAAILSAA